MNHVGKTFAVSACAIATAAFLSACGGGEAGAPFSPTPLAGFAVDGYLNGASVKCDASGVVVKTDSSGFFRFPDGCSSGVTLTGGTSMDTLLPFAGQLKAPAGATVITPLTTLLADGVTLTDLNNALGLPASTDLLNADPAYAPNGLLANEVLMKVTAAFQLALQKTTELLVGLAGSTTADDKQAIYNEVAAAAAAMVKGGSVTLVTGTGSSAALDQTVIASFVKAAALRVGQASAVSTVVKTAVNGVNAESLGLVVAGGLKAQTEAILKSGTALTDTTLTQQNDAQIATFVAANKTALAGAPSTVNALATTLTSQIAGSGGGGSSFAGIDFSATNIQFNPFGNLVSAAIANDPTNSSNRVAKFVKGPGGEAWAGATIYDKGTLIPNSATANVYVDAFDLSTSKIVTLRSYTDAPVGTPITLKLENATNVGQDIQVAVNTTQQNAWETLSFDFATSGNFSGQYNSAFTYNTVSVLPAFNVKTTGTNKPAANTTFYFDDLAYTKVGSSSGGTGGTAPTSAPTTSIPSGSTIVYSDASTISPIDTAPVWGQNPPVVASEQTIASNKSLKYTFGAGALYQGIDWSSIPQDVSGKGTLHLDVWTADVASVKVSLIGGGSENGITKTLTAGAWTSIDIPLSQYTSPDLTKIIQMKLEPNAAGTIYVDNIYFYGTAAAGGGGATTFTGGIFASDYSGNLGANTAKSDKGGTVGFFVDPRLYAVKIFEDGSVCGSACNAGGVYNFYYGIGKPATPTYTDAYFGGFVNAPGNTTADASSFAKVNLKFWGDAESWEKLNFTAQVDVVLQGPTNAACTNPSGRPELTKTVTAQKIGAGSDYTIPKTDFVLTASCGSAYTVNSVWSAVGAVVVRLTGSSNLNYVNLTPSTPPSYPTFINIGPH
jgi:hypothetical protein